MNQSRWPYCFVSAAHFSLQAFMWRIVIRFVLLVSGQNMGVGLKTFALFIFSRSLHFPDFYHPPFSCYFLTVSLNL